MAPARLYCWLPAGHLNCISSRDMQHQHSCRCALTLLAAVYLLAANMWLSLCVCMLVGVCVLEAVQHLCLPSKLFFTGVMLEGRRYYIVS